MPPSLRDWLAPDHLAWFVIDALATIARNQVRIATSQHTYTRLTTPTALQTQALELIDIKLHT